MPGREGDLLLFINLLIIKIGVSTMGCQEKPAPSRGRNKMLYEEFKQRAEAISSRVFAARDNLEAARIIDGIINELGTKKVLTTSTPLVDSLGLEGVLSGKGIRIVRDNIRQEAEDADMGITEVDLCIAETGTLAHNATDVESRLISMLPPVHVALAPMDSLVPTFREAIDLHSRDAGSLPGYLTFISGPSRTADIERVLTIGVHGPEILIVILIEAPEVTTREGQQAKDRNTKGPG